MGALQGKNVVLLWRKLSEQSKNDAKLMIYELEHEVSLSADNESIKTKFATINTPSAPEEEISFTAHVDDEDSIYDYLESAFQDQETVELWQVNLTDKDGEFKKKQKYPAIYRQGKLTELTNTNDAEDLVEISGTFVTDFTRQKGEATFTNDQLEAVAYAFEDIVKKDSADVLGE